MHLNKTHYPILWLCYISSLHHLCEAQLSPPRLFTQISRETTNKSTKLFLPRQMTENLNASCYSECISYLDKHQKNDPILLNLGPAANYTFVIAMPDGSNFGKYFYLQFNLNQNINYSIYLQENNSTELMTFYNFLSIEEGWNEVFIYGDTLKEYKEGNLVLELVNVANDTQVITVLFDYEGLSNEGNRLVLGLILGLIIGSIIYVPLLILLFIMLWRGIKRIKQCWDDSKHQRNLRRWRPVQGAPNPNPIVINPIGDQNQQGAQSAEDGRQDQKIDPINSESLNAKNVPFTAETIDHHFPETQFQDVNNLSSDRACSICLEEITVGVPYRQLYCQHMFHSECIKLWLESQFLKNRVLEDNRRVVQTAMSI